MWGRQHEERKRNLGYRVDYIILAEPAKAGIASKPTPEDLEQVSPELQIIDRWETENLKANLLIRDMYQKEGHSI